MKIKKNQHLIHLLLLIAVCIGLPQIATIVSSIFVFVFNSAIYELFDIRGNYTLNDPKILTLFNGTVIALVAILASREVWRVFAWKIHGFAILMIINTAAFCFFVMTKLPGILALFNNFFVYVGSIYIIALAEIIIYTLIVTKYNGMRAPAYGLVFLYALISFALISFLLFFFVDFKALERFIAECI